MQNKVLFLHISSHSNLEISASKNLPVAQQVTYHVLLNECFLKSFFSYLIRVPLLVLLSWIIQSLCVVTLCCSCTLMIF